MRKEGGRQQKTRRCGANDRQWEQHRERERTEERKSTSCPLLTYCSPLSRFFFQMALAGLA